MSVRLARIVMAAAVAIAAVGCGSGTGSPSEDITTVIPASPGAPAAATPVPGPTEVPGPPRAGLAGLAGPDGSPLAGSLGTFTWDGLTSDAPWVVPSAGGAAAAGAPLEVTFEPPIEPRAWSARWAPVSGMSAGDPVAAGAGQAGPIRVRAPAGARSWSLQVEASFGEGRNGAWYWRLEVAP